MHSWRVTRLDKIKHYVAKSLRKRGYTVLVEYGISTREKGLLRPDLIVWNDSGSYILDVQVTADVNYKPAAELNQSKIDKYDIGEVKDKVKELSGHEPTVEGVTLNWRGTLHRRSERVLLKLRMNRGELDVIMRMALEGGLVMYSNWNGITGGGSGARADADIGIPVY